MSTSVNEDAATREKRVKAAQSRYSSSTSSTLIKVALLGIFDALMIFAAMLALGAKSWPVFGVIAVLLVVVNTIYIPANRMLPGKYLTPGVTFLLLFAVSVTLYTVYASFTNYGDGHNGSKNDAIVSIQKQNQVRVPNSPEYPASIAQKDGDKELWLLVTDPKTKEVKGGSNSNPLEPVDKTELDSTGRVKTAEGFNVLPFSELLNRQADVAALQVPVSDDSTDGYLQAPTGSTAYQYTSAMKYDPATDTFTDPNGKTFHDGGHGAYVDESGTAIDPGWKINVGFKNYASAFSDQQIRTPFLRVLIWTFVFSIVSVLTTFALGLFLAIVFHKKIHGQRLYRVIMVLPYAFPSVMMTMVWAGLMNRDFGFINQVLFNGADIAWLTDPTLAKISILIVNLWLGFPYQFLVCSAALTSIPDDVVEAAEVDGATSWQIFKSIKLPLLMVSLAPLLISSFAFNFNNFNLIYMLTKGGPRFTDTTLDVGASDILISMVYKVAFGDADRLYGLGSAFAVLIFIIVGVVSAIGFSQTKALEDIN